MKKAVFLLAIYFACFVITGCDSQKINNPEDIKAIEGMSAARAEAFNRGDAAAIAIHFTEDGALMAPGTPASYGRDAVEAYYQQIFDEYDTQLDSYYEEVQVSGNLAFGQGIAEVQLIPKDGGEPISSTSKYINILERQDNGLWLTTYDIWNDNN